MKFFDTATQTKYEIDVYQVNGKIKEYGLGKKISVDDYNTLKKENSKLKAENKKLKESTKSDTKE